MLNVTIETNGLIHAEQGSPEGKALRTVIEQMPESTYSVHLPAISASELQKGGKYLLDFNKFLQRVQSIGLKEGDLLLPLAYWGVAFWDHALCTSDQAEKLEKSVHNILFPPDLYTCPPGLGDDFKSDTPHPGYVKWRNVKCDVLAMWCHIFHGGDVFVTADENFHTGTKKDALIALGAKAIVRPLELPAYIKSAV